MQLTLCTCTAERNRVNKSNFISNQLNLIGTIKKPTSVTNVVIEIQHNTPLAYYYNYAWIDKFGRWYFIDDIKNIASNRWELHLSVDVLYTYLTDITQATAIIDKVEDENGANLYLNDGSFVMDSRVYNTVKEFPNGLNSDGQYILICAGG